VLMCHLVSYKRACIGGEAYFFVVSTEFVLISVVRLEIQTITLTV